VITAPKLEPMAADWISRDRLRFFVDFDHAYVIDADGRNLRAIHPDSIRSATRDSSVLIFESQRDHGSSVYAMNRSRTQVRQLTKGFWAEEPSIAPNESRIVFEKRVNPDKMEESEIVLMNLDGTAQTTIAGGTDPSWSPDGKTILYKAMDASGKLWVSLVDVATRKTHRLVRGVHPQWSPSGDRILYMSDGTDGDANVYVMSASGKPLRCLTCARGAQGKP
jgi:Tol biopolymer transport system component